MSWSHPRGAGTACELSAFDFPHELALALRALWEGTIGRRLDGAVRPTMREEA